MWNNNTIEDEIQRNILEYGIAVNTDRSIPDAKSGLKPVARRILWDAFVEGRLNSKPHVKSARIVGDTMGRFHPHGDSSIYGAMVRLSQDWVLRYPLIDGHGNFGNILGDGPAAMRYTEARLSKLAEEGLLQGIKKNAVDFIPNYDETEEEPVTLPSIFPNLLCNPNEGIGWALACSWAPHNLNEVAAAIKQVIAGEEPMLPGPDFPTGGTIINKKDIPSIMRTGHGSVKIRGNYTIENQNIVFYEIPYGTRVETLMTEIGNACEANKLTNIVDIRNETSTKGIRLVIEVEKGFNPESIVSNLFTKTNLQTSFSYNQVALIDKIPTELNLKQAIDVYINHNKDCIVREAAFDINKALARLEIVNGLLKALASIDEIIALIKGSESAAVAKTALIKRYEFSEIQAKAILDMKLARLAKLEGVELENEKADLEAKIEELDFLINNEDKQIEELIIRLDAIVKKYGDARRTKLMDIEIPKDKKEKEVAEVVPEDVVVVTNQAGYIKRIPVASFKVQRRGTKGIKTADETILDVVKTNTVDTMMFFTDKGRMYRCLVDKIIEGDNTSKGMHISDLVKLETTTEKVIAVSSLHRKTTPKYIYFITKKGLIKKSLLSEYTQSTRNTGLQAIKLGAGDSIANIIFMDDEDVVVVTKKGMGIKFDTKTINAIGRLTTGVKAIKLEEGDEVVAGLPVHKETDCLALVAEAGIGKKLALTELPRQTKGGKGIILYKDQVVAGAAMVSDEDNILIIGRSTVTISAKDIPQYSKTADGVILIKSKIKQIVKL